ncbi:MAG: sulfite exporter TauE/SafE family protein [Candidatus Melainabacteria bacterium]|nr:sulfite exporter TauE/SafE family protein [Candidatus Melainabacteria bacterium]
MDIFLISFFAFISSLISLFSGFGVNSVMLPVFAIFFPINIAVAFTAIVHFLNNLFKLTLLGKYADKTIVLKFGIPAILTAFFGARTLNFLAGLEPIANYELCHKEFFITPIKLVIATIIFSFALFDILPSLQKFSFDKRLLPLGGLLSGFIGGLSGHQGGLRSAFLIKCNLSKESFIGTGVLIACMVDISRLIAYSSFFLRDILSKNITLLILTILFSLLGVLLGNKLLKKVTYESIQKIVGLMLITVGIMLMVGII